ncbi:MBL fold metallo-hydrolase [Nonomuraea jiangxiensis]|uniref:Ribonuclease BN, tRNA processing enzyme n=1 Tax=Nonomuraea jiangxiensis TaxID=633440 RepID=A0A1G8I6G4_9ACTN|nr:MBL fold metallo-hydrolase [Nonomuraea jiangxiensis]SDI14351.1 Ribonuclease BN, tRNA processing enzyme [Nonomuraea jiangxiensis]
MRLTVLGCRAGMPSGGVASSGYLVTTGVTRLLLDCGPGITTALGGVVRPGSLSGIVISHLHLDHCYDLLPLGRRILSDQLAGSLAAPDAGALGPAIPLYVPVGGRDLLRGLAGLFPLSTVPILDRVFELALDVREYRPDDVLEIGDCHVGMHALRHAQPNCGSRVRGPAATLAYTGDTGVTDALHELAKDVDLLLAEATLDETDGSRHGHLSAADAARAAQAAGAAQLMITHFPDGDAVRDARRAEAELHFDGPVHVAAPGLSHDLP